jgi:hypothetical protein
VGRMIANFLVTGVLWILSSWTFYGVNRSLEKRGSETLWESIDNKKTRILAKIFCYLPITGFAILTGVVTVGVTNDFIIPFFEKPFKKIKNLIFYKRIRREKQELIELLNKEREEKIKKGRIRITEEDPYGEEDWGPSPLTWYERYSTIPQHRSIEINVTRPTNEEVEEMDRKYLEEFTEKIKEDGGFVIKSKTVKNRLERPTKVKIKYKI